ncbi:MAG: methionyl-tRNA formyltransferase [gamma proteobacterium symbiont of Bathyaustriella thionipta]|nr:methionyl-tRNA formyltransferase [gamma proteobacterium symbiont of Bathyaustriella thionipta]
MSSLSNAHSLRVLFAGTPEFSVSALRALIDSQHELIGVYTQPDRPAGRGRKLSASPVKSLALEHHIEVCQPLSLKDEKEQQRLQKMQADVMVVVASGLILPPAVLTAPRLGCINIHASLLPRWRGAAPIHRAILAGDTETGVTIMQMDEGLDTGDRLLTLRCPIKEEDSSQSLHDRLAALGAEALMQALPAIVDGSIQAQPQDDALATYAHKLKKEEADIDWRQPAEVICRQVRGLNPWPVAQTTFNAGKLRIFAAVVVNSDQSAAAGSVLQASADGIDVACGEGVLRILSLQMPGKRRMPAADFINAQCLDGVVFGASA